MNWPADAFDGNVVHGSGAVLSRTHALLETLFVGRTDMLVNGVPVDVRHPGIQLAGASVWDRLDRLMAPAGIACARRLIDRMALPLAAAAPPPSASAYTPAPLGSSDDIGASHLWAYLNEGVSHVVCWYQGPAHLKWVRLHIVQGDWVR